MQRTYHSYEDPDKAIDADDISQGYKYGRTLVPFSKIDKAALKFPSEACLKLIGYCNKNKVPRTNLFISISLIIPLTGWLTDWN